MIWYILWGVFSLLGLVNIFSFVIFDDSWVNRLQHILIAGIIGIIFLFLAKICWNQGLKITQQKCIKYNNTTYIQQIHNKQYKEQLGIIDNISSNTITIKDYNEGYYLNKDSEIRNFNNFKPCDKVDIYYIVNGYNCNIIMTINKIN